MSFTEVSEPLTIDCDSCVSQHTNACDDCIVSFICGQELAGGVVIDVAEFRAMRLLSDGGLMPQLRHRRRTG